MTARRKPLLEAIERSYGHKIGDVVEMLYKRYGSFDDVAREIGTTRQTLYNWVGIDRMRRIRGAQLMTHERETTASGNGAKK